MIFIRRCIIVLSGALISSWGLYFLWDRTGGSPTTESTWTCTGDGRNQICEFTNFCIDSFRGPFIVSSSEKEVPRIQMINTGQGEDIWFQPKRVSHHVNAKHIDETLFVYGLYSPYHFSHFLYNGLMPLYSLMQEKKAPPSSYTLRVATYDNKHTPLDMILPSGPDIVLERADQLTPKQITPSYKPMCFSKAVVGTGNRCSLWYCDNQIPAEHYASYKRFILQDHPEVPNNPCAASTVVHKKEGQYKVGILNRKHNRHIVNVPELISALSALTSEKDGFDVSIVTIDFEKGCDTVNTAHAVKDLDVLIAPFGNGLGAGLYMKDDAALISIAARYYNEPWFKFPMTAIGRRIFSFECNRGVCQEYDEKFARQILEENNIYLNETEMQIFLTTDQPKDLVSKYIPNYTSGEEWNIFLQFYKDVSRRVDVERFIPYLRNIIVSKPPKDLPYYEVCKKDGNVCCDHPCEGPLDRNVFGKDNAWKTFPK